MSCGSDSTFPLSGSIGSEFPQCGSGDRDVNQLLAERGLDLSYETVGLWVQKLGPSIARRLRRRHPGDLSPAAVPTAVCALLQTAGAVPKWDRINALQRKRLRSTRRGIVTETEFERVAGEDMITV